MTETGVPNTGASSPFAPLLMAQENVPAAIWTQYMLAPGDETEIVLGGKMDRIWRRPFWLLPVFWLLSLWNIFFPETGKDIPTTLVVSAERDADGYGVQKWIRTFHFPNGKNRRYISTMKAHPDKGKVVELQGPDNRFKEIARVRFLESNTIEFLTIESYLHFGRFAIRLPRILWIEVLVRQKAIEGQDNLSRVSLEIMQPLLGPIFGYEGTFRATPRKTKANAEPVRL